MVRNKLRNVQTMWVCQGSELAAGDMWGLCSTNHNLIPETGTVVTLPQTRGWLWSVPAPGPRSQQSLSSPGKVAAEITWACSVSAPGIFKRQENGLEGSKSPWLSLCQAASKVELQCRSSCQACRILLQGGAALPGGLGGSTEPHWVFGWKENVLMVSFSPRASVLWCLTQYLSWSVLAWLLESVTIYWISMGRIHCFDSWRYSVFWT